MKKILIAVAALAVIGGAAYFVLSPEKVSGEEAASVSPSTNTASADQSTMPAGEAWFVRCNKDKDGKDLAAPKKGDCEVFQKLIHNETKGRLVEFAVGYPPTQTAARGIVILPLGINVQAGAQIHVDKGKPFAVQIRYCDNGGCYAFMDASDELLSQMKSGQVMTITVQSMKPQNINIEMPLKGFGDALKKVS